MVRDTGEDWYDQSIVIGALLHAGFKHDKDFIIMQVPNIVDITYGRNVGYTITEERLDKSIESISATEIREITGAPV